MKAAIRFFDGRGEKTLLYDSVLKKAGVKTLDDFIPEVYKIFHDKKQNFKQYISSFSPLIDASIRRNDSAALQIRKETSEELIGGVRAVVSRLKIGNEKLCVGLAGSVWKMPGLQELFMKEVKKQFPGAIFSEKKEPPVRGAIAMAKKLMRGSN